MDVLVPREITTAKLISSSVAEPDTGETVWNAATSYTIGDRAILNSTHRVYRNLLGGVNAKSPETAPDRWFDEGPTNRWALFDGEVSSNTVSPSPFTMTVRPGSINDIAFFGLVNVDRVRIRVWDSPGGNLVYDETRGTEDFWSSDLYWSYYFDEPRQRTVLSFGDIPASQTCEVELTATSFDAQPLEIGMAAFGSFESLGVSEYGFSASPKDYSRITEDEYGTTRVQKRRNAKNIRGQVYCPTQAANAAVSIVYRLLGVPAVWRPSNLAQYDFLTTFGLGSADISASGPDESRLSIDVRGLI
jgi:hypothetical protein